MLPMYNDAQKHHSNICAADCIDDKCNLVNSHNQNDGTSNFLGSCRHWNARNIWRQDRVLLKR